MRGRTPTSGLQFQQKTLKLGTFLSELNVKGSLVHNGSFPINCCLSLSLSLSLALSLSLYLSLSLSLRLYETSRGYSASHYFALVSILRKFLSIFLDLLHVDKQTNTTNVTETNLQNFLLNTRQRQSVQLRCCHLSISTFIPSKCNKYCVLQCPDSPGAHVASNSIRNAYISRDKKDWGVKMTADLHLLSRLTNEWS